MPKKDNEYKLRWQRNKYKNDKNFRKFRKYASWYKGLRLKDITPKEYFELFDKQSGYCPICGKHQSECGKRFSVDHNHATGEIRGLLCTWCNMNLGWYEKFDDNIKVYLKGGG